DTPIEFVIADNPGVVAEIIEQIDHQLAFIAQTDVGALINIACIDQDRISILLPPLPNLRHATSESADVRIPIVIDRRQNMPVQIGCMQDRDRSRVISQRISRARKTWEPSDQS